MTTSGPEREGYSGSRYSGPRDSGLRLASRSYRGGYSGPRSGSRSGRGGFSSRKQECFKCGGEFPHPRDCPAKDNYCVTCKRYGHYKELCNFAQEGEYAEVPRGRSGSSTYRGRYSDGRSGARAVYVEDEVREEVEESYGANSERPQSLSAMTDGDMFVFAAAENSKFCEKGRIRVLIDNKVPVKFLPDTGASVDIIDRSTYDILCQSNVYPLFESGTRIFAYGSEEPLKLRGYFNAKGSFEGKVSLLTIYVLDARNCGNLLSKTSCENLRVIEVCSRGNVENVNNVSGTNNISATNNILS